MIKNKKKNLWIMKLRKMIIQISECFKVLINVTIVFYICATIDINKT